MMSKTVLVLLGAVALCVAAVPQLRPAPLPMENLAKMPRAQALTSLKALLRGPLEAALLPAVETPAMRGVIEDQISALIEKMRVVMQEGSESMGIPVLDPFNFEHVEVHTHQSLLDLDAGLDEFLLEGLSGFVVDNLKWSTLLLTFNLGMTFPMVEATGAYNADAILAGLLPIYGEGPFDIQVGDLVITAKAKLGIKGLGFYVRTLDLDFTLGHFHSDISGLLGGGDLSDLINEVINDLVPEIIEANTDIITGILSDIIIDIANSILGASTREEVLEFIDAFQKQ